MRLWFSSRGQKRRRGGKRHWVRLWFENVYLPGLSCSSDCWSPGTLAAITKIRVTLTTVTILTPRARFLLRVLGIITAIYTTRTSNFSSANFHAQNLPKCPKLIARPHKTQISTNLYSLSAVSLSVSGERSMNCSRVSDRPANSVLETHRRSGVHLYTFSLSLWKI